MITIKQHLPGQNLTYSQRRRLIELLWTLISNATIPFILGYFFSLISMTYSITEIATSFDKSGYGVCIQPDFQENHAITGAAMTDINYTADNFAKEEGFTDEPHFNRS